MSQANGSKRVVLQGDEPCSACAHVWGGRRGVGRLEPGTQGSAHRTGLPPAAPCAMSRGDPRGLTFEGCRRAGQLCMSHSSHPRPPAGVAFQAVLGMTRGCRTGRLGGTSLPGSINSAIFLYHRVVPPPGPGSTMLRLRQVSLRRCRNGIAPPGPQRAGPCVSARRGLSSAANEQDIARKQNKLVQRSPMAESNRLSAAASPPRTLDALWPWLSAAHWNAVSKGDLLSVRKFCPRPRYQSPV